jgi:pimeloyl-ACP methyl ester carboxylesterase
MRLRLYHHRDGARVAYREAGTGPPLALLHAGLLSHREFSPVVEHLADRFRVILPDLPLHGDSEDRPRHPYSLAWLADVMTGFTRDVLGARPLIGGHDLGAEVLLRAVADHGMRPARLILLPTRLHRPLAHPGFWRAWRTGARVGGLPLADRGAGHAARLLVRPELRDDAAARDLVRHALADAPGNANLARSWARFARTWPAPGPQREVLDTLARLPAPTLLLWADGDEAHPLSGAEEALDLLPRGQLRVLPGTGFLLAHEDPVGLARELAAFCRTTGGARGDGAARRPTGR